eukprot:gb/GFBE01079861.1/.p1 GENE.gb/GFBE01079861.1/~~gb/GFBE01079861.1/.p1  ORF type:complete len:296 (+),score=58.96 gb/GFBE01079861.1/:1-888(+)
MSSGFLLCCSSRPRGDLSSIIGRPRSAVCPAGQCAFSEEWSPAKLIERTQITHNVVLLTFALRDASQYLNLPTCACVLSRFTDEDGLDGTPEVIVRPYTPISPNDQQGTFQLLVKVYKSGKMSQHLNTLPLGRFVEFSHIKQNLKIQYPFGKKHITMIVGGTGITPMIQALHAILGTPGDSTQVTMFFGNKTQKDILGEELLESWSKASGDRLKVIHMLSEAADDTTWHGVTGFITRELLEQHAPPPSEDSMVMVCGPPPMYNVLIGGVVVIDGLKQLNGMLRDMGYSSDQVYIF